MTNDKFKKAISKALCDEYSESISKHNSDHVFSDSFNKKMDKLIKRQKKPYYRLINTAGKRVACFVVLVLVASFTTVISVDAFREAFKDFFMKIFSTHSEISAVDDSNENVPGTIENNYEITYDLTGYDIIFDERNEYSRNITYQKGEMVIDYYQYVKPKFDFGLNTENAEITTLDINGREAIYYCDNRNYYNIIWDNGEYVIMLSSNIGKNELISIANSVQKVE